LKEEPYNRSRRQRHGNDCDEPEPTSVDLHAKTGPGTATLHPVFSRKRLIYLIRAKLKVSIGVIIASLTQRRALLQWFKLEIVLNRTALFFILTF